MATFKEETATGYASALNIGEVQITAQYATLSATSQLTVNEIAITSLEIAPATTAINLGQNRQLSLIGHYADGTKADITKAATWQSSSPNVATVSASGLLKALAIGSTLITATDKVSGQHAQCPINVSQAPLEVVSIAITPAQAILKVNGTCQFTAQATYSDESTADITGSVKWSCQPDAKAEITTLGLATARELTGDDSPAQIVASYQVGTKTVTEQAPLLVTDMPSFTVKNVYFHNISGELTAKVVATDSNGEEYECSFSAAMPASEASQDKIDLTVFAKLQDSSHKIKSMTFYNTLSDGETKCPFEWWEANEGQNYHENLELDIEENEYAGGTEGNEEDPFLVANPRQLDNVRHNLLSCFQQTRDIDFENSFGMSAALDEEGIINFSDTNQQARYYNSGSAWLPIGPSDDSPFVGKYFGQKFKIEHLLIKAEATDEEQSLYAGLFGLSNGAFFEKIAIDSGYISATNGSAYAGGVCAYAGGVCAYAGGNCSMNTCNNQAIIVVKSQSTQSLAAVGGLCGGGDNLSLNNCSNNGSLEATSSQAQAYGGGIVGSFNGGSAKFENCTNSGPVKAVGNSEASSYQDVCAGGIVGFAASVNGYSSEGNNSGSITATSTTKKAYAGGIVAEGSGFTNVANSGSVTASSSSGYTYVGGLISFSTDSYNMSDGLNCGTLASQGSSCTAYMGGICGQIDDYDEGIVIANAYNAGAITCETANNNLGAILGSENGILSNTFFLENNGASKGQYGHDNEVGHSLSITKLQLTNHSKVTYATDNDMDLWEALNAGHSGGQTPWRINSSDKEIIPYGYSILTFLVPTNTNN